MEAAGDTGKDETKPQLQAEKLKPQLHSYWNFRSVVFQVENTLFSVLKHGFIEPGTPFETMFSLPPEDPKNVEGSSDDNPIILEDTTVNDFVAFLRVLYPVGVEKVDSYNDWMGVLRLSHKWGFIQMRTSAIEGLTPHVTKMAEHDKISLGSTFLVQEWFREGLVDIATKRELEIGCLTRKPFFFNQGTIIKFLCLQKKGFECQLSNLRYDDYQCESCRTKMIDTGDRDVTKPIIHYCPQSYRTNITNLVDEYFEEEINHTGFNV